METDYPTVFVGRNDIDVYIERTLSYLSEDDEAHIMARGRKHIGKAVVVGEILRDRYGKGVEIESRTDVRPDTGDSVTAVDITVLQD